jgi:hypothetical protein
LVKRNSPEVNIVTPFIFLFSEEREVLLVEGAKPLQTTPARNLTEED